MQIFDHERLDVYQLSLDFVVAADALRTSVLARRPALGDQLDRASTSIVLNVAEGAGEYKPREKARFYRMARRSGTECAAILDIINRLGLGSGTETDTPRVLLRRIVSMLVVLAKSREQSEQR